MENRIWVLKSVLCINTSILKLKCFFTYDLYRNSGGYKIKKNFKHYRLLRNHY